MHIGIVSRNFVYPAGGFEEHIFQLSKRIAKKHNLEITTTTYQSPVTYEKISGLAVKRFPYKYRLGGYYYSTQLFRYLKANSFDILHAHGWETHAVDAAFKAAKIKGIPLVVTPHEFEHVIDKKKVFEKIYNSFRGKKILKNSNVIALTEHQKQFFESIGIKHVNKIPNGIAYRRYQKKTRKYDTPTLVAIGRISEYKGFQHIINAIKDIDNVNLKIIGKEWGYLETLKKIIAKLNMHERVELVLDASEKEKIKILNASHALVSASQHEGFGLTLLEGMACGLPVISTNVGIAPDMSSEFCSLFNFGDVNKLKELTTEVLSKKINSNKAKKHVKDYYSWDKIAMEIEKLYMKLVEGEKKWSGTNF